MGGRYVWRACVHTPSSFQLARTGPTTRAGSKPKVNFLRPIRVNTNLLALAMSAMGRGLPASPEDADEDVFTVVHDQHSRSCETPLDQDAISEPLSEPASSDPHCESDNPLEEGLNPPRTSRLSRAFPTVTSYLTTNSVGRAEKRKARSKARKKASRKVHRAREAAARRARGHRPCEPKIVTLRALLRGKPIYLRASLTEDSTFDAGNTAKFPVASTGYVGARYMPTSEELDAQTLDDFKRRGFTIVEWDGK